MNSAAERPNLFKQVFCSQAQNSFWGFGAAISAKATE
jgi:hypothetical protein